MDKEVERATRIVSAAVAPERGEERAGLHEAPPLHVDGRDIRVFRRRHRHAAPERGDAGTWSEPALPAAGK